MITACSQNENSSLVTKSVSSAVSRDFSLDELSIANSLNSVNYLVSGTCEQSNAQIEVNFNGGELIQSFNCNNFKFEEEIDISSIADSGSLSIELSDGVNTINDSITKDTSTPEITSNVVVANTYNTGDELNVTVNFDEVVFVSSSPRIELAMENQSSTDLHLSYSSGSGSNQIVFKYNIQAGDNDLNGIALGPDLDISTGGLFDSSGNPAALSLDEINFPSVFVDTNAPSISSIIKPVDGTYADGGGELTFQINFSEAVIVTNTPRLQITVGPNTRYADYISGSGTTGLEFKHTIQSGDNDSDGISYASTTIDLNGATISSQSDGDDASLVFTSFVTPLSAVLVNTSSGVTAPDKVTGVTTAPTTSNTALSLAWSTPNNNGTDIINYTVQYREQGYSTWINTPTVTSTTTTISGLSAGVVYEFRVAANNTLLGPYSDISNAEIFDVLSLNPIAWLSATNISNGGTEPSNGDKVAVWKDLTGSASDATETNPANQPTYETNVYNGLPAVKFDGSLVKGLEGTFTRTNNAGLTIFVVAKYTGSARRAFFEFYKTGGGTSPGSPRGFFFTYGFNNASVSYNLDQTSFNIWSAYDTGTKTDFWENGGLVYSNWSNWGNTSFTGSGSYVLGDDQTGGDRLNGYLGEFLIFDGQLTAAQTTTIQTYLKNKWGTP